MFVQMFVQMLHREIPGRSRTVRALFLFSGTLPEMSLRHILIRSNIRLHHDASALQVSDRRTAPPTFDGKSLDDVMRMCN